MSSEKVFIIAEAGVNHNGSIDLAKQLIDAAVDSGADAVKFQTFQANKLASLKAPKAEYQQKATGNTESQYEMLKKLELSQESHFTLVKHAKEKKIQLLSTPFDEESADFLLHELNLPIIKIPSGEITTAPLILHIARGNKPVILSTGMATLGDIELALGVLAFGFLNLQAQPSAQAFMRAFCSDEGQKVLKEKVTLLHCTSSYPADFRDINLRAMDTLRTAFALPVGYSDHSKGISVPIAAVARGATLIEKHFTLDRELPGPDHRASLEPSELQAMVQSIREVEQALGQGNKLPTTEELKTRVVARKSLVALCPIQKDETFSRDSLGIKRPGNGVAPVEYWDFLERAATRNYEVGELIDE
jgi:N-acetylneuraminate synthase